ncbi:hypothetical protein JAAARDRAFT_188470 [Jaapia argillacea MUCL 33604]|uniref:Uncharacterized protein n=1 Tax=Jaapia argillacea MUCL 33604 TaxID=933084 RepID=A0A067QG99_9AGAM|nr:hypothetical protein JAAARDRAFT_188470 [Jaapia argillacea MUCL 33604]
MLEKNREAEEEDGREEEMLDETLDDWGFEGSGRSLEGGEREMGLEGEGMEGGDDLGDSGNSWEGSDGGGYGADGADEEMLREGHSKPEAGPFRQFSAFRRMWKTPG